jgi:FkbM family methyltransferase
VNLRALARDARRALRLARRDGLRGVARKLASLASRRGQTTIEEAHLALKLFDGRGVLVDVGAHEGRTLAPFADAGWTIYAFEPDDTNRAWLTSLYRSSKNVVIDARGIGERESRGVPFYRSDLSTGLGTLAPFDPSHRASGTIDLTTIARVCEEHRLSQIDLLKIDTEGHDLFVLRGVPWDTCAPRVVVCEFEDKKTVPLGYGFHDLAGYLRERGYQVVVSEWYPVVRYGQTHRWRRFAPYPSELADPAAWGNLIATRIDADHRALLALCDRSSMRR